ncbi:MAG: hypothetical protein OZSIB_1712 [Candidatus Ozemobacter sibiricus]|uniref:FecR protein domain-containing protein n=1 Tax=Candidatus Ozemobacter sibiricus TaxID=2268124 RepID=A0A367ZJC2_9BACT|nr:MAG: hypothetical protein OZSIB_1712 [Candidatus Ozemobacter sibiricus]
MKVRASSAVVIVCGLVLAGCLWSPLTAQQALSTSELIKVEGKVEVKKGQAPTFKPVPPNLKLAGALKRLDGGDKVRTGVQSGAELMLKDTCVLAVKEGSLFEVPLVIGEKGLAQLKAQQGSFLFKVVSGSDFKVQTADVVAAVKGTLFEVEMTDSFHKLLQLPGLEIGIDNIGGTMVDVYEGEVELTNQASKATRRLKAGQGISVLNRLLMGLDKNFAEGFSPIRAFDPLERLRKNFGQVGELLHGLASTRQGLLGFDSTGLSLPLGRLNLGERLGRFSEGFAPELRQKLTSLGSSLGELRSTLEEWKKIGQALKGEEFKPRLDERRFPRQKFPLIVPEVAVKEACLGDGLFVAVGPRPGCQVVRLTPEEDQGLVLQEGEGTFRIRDFLHGIDGVVTVRQEAGQLVTVLEMTDGTLHVRIPGELEVHPVGAKQRLAFVTSQADGSSRRLEPAPALDPNPKVLEYSFRAEAEIAKQRAEHEQKVGKARQEAIEKVVDQLKDGKGRDQLKEKAKDLKNLGKNLRNLWR